MGHGPVRTINSRPQYISQLPVPLPVRTGVLPPVARGTILWFRFAVDLRYSRGLDLLRGSKDAFFEQLFISWLVAIPIKSHMLLMLEPLEDAFPSTDRRNFLCRISHLYRQQQKPLDANATKLHTLQ